MNQTNLLLGRLEVEPGIGLIYHYHFREAAHETVVFIHAHSADQRMWEPQINHFTSHYSVLTYDLRGYGESSMPFDGKHFLHAEDLRMLLDHLHIDYAHVIGLSLGSFVTLDFWSMYPDRVRSVTVASGAIPDPKPDVPPPLVTDLPRFKQEWFARLQEGCGEDRNGYQDRLRTMIADWTGWQHTHNEPDCILGEGVLNKLLAIQNPGPVCIINGRKDFKGAHHSADRLLQCMPHAVTVYLSEAGHFSNMETPDEFNAALGIFLNRGGFHPDSKSDLARL